MEKSPQDSCVGSVPFDYRYAGDCGLPPDAGRNDSRSDLEKEPELPFQEAPAETRINNAIHVDHIDDAIPIADCKGLLNRKAVHEIAMRLANEQFNMAIKFNRVSPKFIDALELEVQRELVRAVRRHPSPLFTRTIKEF